MRLTLGECQCYCRDESLHVQMLLQQLLVEAEDLYRLNWQAHLQSALASLLCIAHLVPSSRLPCKSLRFANRVANLRGTEADTPAAAWVLPLNRFAVTGNIACSAFETVFIGKVHFTTKQLKKASRTNIDAWCRVASIASFTINANMWCFINFKAYKI